MTLQELQPSNPRSGSPGIPLATASDAPARSGVPDLCAPYLPHGRSWVAAAARRLAGSVVRSLARPLPAASRNPGGSGLQRDRGEAGKRPDKPVEVEGLGRAAAEGALSLLPALGAALGDFPSPGKNVCVFGMERRGRACATKVAGSRIFRSQSPLSPAVIMEFSAAERASGWHAKPGTDRGAGLRSTLTPPDLPLLHSSHPPPRKGSAYARGEIGLPSSIRAHYSLLQFRKVSTPSEWS